MHIKVNYNHIDKFIIVSAGSYILPLFHEIKLSNKKIEVIGFQYNTSPEYLRNIDIMKIPYTTVEDILGLKKYIDKNDEQFNSKYLDNLPEFTKILEQINCIMLDIYNKHLRRDNHGNPIVYGTTNLGNLADMLKERKICPLEEINNKSFINLLRDNNIIIEKTYTKNSVQNKTYLLSDTYLSSRGISINNLLTISQFS